MTVFPLKYLPRENPCSKCPCPSSDFVPLARGAFRFVRGSNANSDSFLPVALLPTPNKYQTCRAYALSFFVTREEARDRFRALWGRFKENAYERYGDQIGEINLSESDGVQSPAGRDGHFSLFESANLIWTPARISNYEALEIDDT